jgi:tRNA (uracil-5-)-methyltransferase TRM9
MRTSTIQALSAINRSFYLSEAAREFSDTRNYPWPGWSRVLSGLPNDAKGGGVLDVGCGNGRFARYIQEILKNDFRYVGIDISDSLLDIARAQVPESERNSFANIDVSRLYTEPQLLPGPFSLIVAFGVLHHIPSLDGRRELLSALLRRLTPDGRLAITFWRFGNLPRFSRKVVSWAEYNQTAAQPVDENDLEEGDYLLRWGSGQDSYRYCHLANDKEIDALINSLNVKTLDHFLSDGEDHQLNQYAVLDNRMPS